MDIQSLIHDTNDDKKTKFNEELVHKLKSIYYFYRFSNDKVHAIKEDELNVIFNRIFEILKQQTNDNIEQFRNILNKKFLCTFEHCRLHEALQDKSDVNSKKKKK